MVESVCGVCSLIPCCHCRYQGEISIDWKNFSHVLRVSGTPDVDLVDLADMVMDRIAAKNDSSLRKIDIAGMRV